MSITTTPPHPPLLSSSVMRHASTIFNVTPINPPHFPTYPPKPSTSSPSPSYPFLFEDTLRSLRGSSALTFLWLLPPFSETSLANIAGIWSFSRHLRCLCTDSVCRVDVLGHGAGGASSGCVRRRPQEEEWYIRGVPHLLPNSLFIIACNQWYQRSELLKKEHLVHSNAFLIWLYQGGGTYNTVINTVFKIGAMAWRLGKRHFTDHMGRTMCVCLGYYEWMELAELPICNLKAKLTSISPQQITFWSEVKAKWENEYSLIPAGMTVI